MIGSWPKFYNHTHAIIKNNPSLQAVVDDARKVEVAALTSKYNISKDSDKLLDAAVPDGNSSSNDKSDVSNKEPDDSPANYVKQKSKDMQSSKSLRVKETEARIACYSAIASQLFGKDDNKSKDGDDAMKGVNDKGSRDREPPQGVRPYEERRRRYDNKNDGVLQYCLM